MKKIFVFLFVVLFFTALYSQTKTYRVLSRGRVRDNSTGLIWARCSLGKDNSPIYDFQCNGEKKRYTYEQAVNACENLVHEGRSDWRLPSIRELHSVAVLHFYSTTEYDRSQLNEEAFPGVISLDEFADGDEMHFWSSTAHSNPAQGWFIDFRWGSAGFADKATTKFVRCVAGPDN